MVKPTRNVRITASVRPDLVEWLRAKAQWQQRSMSSLVEDALIMLREDMGEPGHPRHIDRLPAAAQRNLARVRERHGKQGRDIETPR
jgi:hypothetical protein